MNITLKKATALGALSLVAIMSASAMGVGGMMGSNATPDEIAARQASMFTQQASLIGATADEVKNAWAEGKSFTALAKEKGISETDLKTKVQSQRLSDMKSHLSTLVSKGVITQAQADKRLVTMQAQSTKNGKGGMRGMHGGMGGMMGGF